jgi:hypothetical protein
MNTKKYIYPPFSIYYASMILFHRAKIYSFDKDIKTFADWYPNALKTHIHSKHNQRHFLNQIETKLHTIFQLKTYESIEFLQFYNTWYSLVHYTMPFLILHAKYYDFLDFEYDLIDWYSMLEYQLSYDYWRFLFPYTIPFYGTQTLQIIRSMTKNTKTLQGYCIPSNEFHNNKDYELSSKQKNPSTQDKLDYFVKELNKIM